MANMNMLNTRIILRKGNTVIGGTPDWSDQVLLKGEVGLEFIYPADYDQSNPIPEKIKIKIGDGQRPWNELPYFGGDECRVTEIEVAKGADHSEAITATITGTTNKGDIAIVKEKLIADEDLSATVTQKYQYTAYVYGETSSGAAWKAMDGNYSADNVYFDSDFTFTTNIGTVTGVTSSKTVDAAGKSVKQFFSSLFAKETHVTSATQPSVGCTLKNDGVNLTADTYYEVGTSVSPSYVSTFEDGRYAYGPEPTGVEVTSWEVSSTAGESFTTQNGTCAPFTVADGTSYSVTAKANYSEGDLALSNIGNEGTYKIPASYKSSTTKKIIGYRKQFYGTKKVPVELTSETIRSLNSAMPTVLFPDNGATGKVNNQTNGFKLIVEDGTRQVIIALCGRVLKNVYDSAFSGNDIKASFVEVSANKEIFVEGANGYSTASYNVYVYSPNTVLGSSTYDVVIGSV